MSDEKTTHLSHLILKGITAGATLSTDETKVLREIKRVLAEESKLDEEIDQYVRKRLASYSRPLPEGSTEWQVLYRKTYSEELAKRNR